MNALLTALLTALAPLLLAAAPAANPPPAADTVEARLGQMVLVGGPRLRVLRVLEDSRCPANAMCVWPGRVRLRLRIWLGRRVLTREIASDAPLPVADGALTLVSARPARRAGAALRNADYRFAFRFAGGM